MDNTFPEPEKINLNVNGKLLPCEHSAWILILIWKRSNSNAMVSYFAPRDKIEGGVTVKIQSTKSCSCSAKTSSMVLRNASRFMMRTPRFCREIVQQIDCQSHNFLLRQTSSWFATKIQPWYNLDLLNQMDMDKIQ